MNRDRRRQAILKFINFKKFVNFNCEESEFFCEWFLIVFCQNTIKRFLMIVTDQSRSPFMNGI